MSNQTIKHQVTLEETEGFGKLIKAYEEYSGHSVTDVQRKKIFATVVKTSVDGEVEALLGDESPITKVAIDLLCGEGNKSLKPEFY